MRIARRKSVPRARASKGASRTTRRTFLKTSVQLAAAAGLGSSAATWTTLRSVVYAAAPACPGTGTVVIGMEAEPPNLDPGQYLGLHSYRPMFRVYEGLTWFDTDTLKITPRLAESWTISGDGLVYTFKLRRGVKFHDGTQFDAQAVKLGLGRAIDTDNPFHQLGAWSFTNYLAPIKSIDVVDAYTVRMTLKARVAPFLAYLGTLTTAIVSPAAQQKYGKDFVRNPVGTGPFRFSRWESGNRIVIERNADYWGGKSCAETLIFRFITDDQARVNELLTGNVDVIVNVLPDALPRLARDSRFALLKKQSLHFWWAGLNVNKKPLSDVRVRRALNYAVNRPALVQGILKGTATVEQGYGFPGAFYNADVDHYRYDPTAAKQLLREAGYPNGFEMEFWVPESGSGMQRPQEMATLIQANLAAVGVRAKIQTFEWGAYLVKLRSGEADMYEDSWFPRTDDPDLTLYANLHSKSAPAPNFNRYSNPEVDRLLDEGRAELDQTKRVAMYRRIQQILAQDAPWIPVDHDIQIVAMKKSVKGLKLIANYDLRTETAYTG